MTNLELFKDAATLDAMWLKRQAVLEKYTPGLFGSCNYGDIEEYYATHTVGKAEAAKHLRRPFEWAMCDTPDYALLPEYDPDSIVMGSEPGVDWYGKYGIVKGYALDSWYHGYRMLYYVHVDFGSGIQKCQCPWLKKADVPKAVMDFLIAKFADGGLKERVHEKVDEAFTS